MAVIGALLQDLKALGVCEGDMILVHSSLNGLRRGYADYDAVTPKNVIDTLLAAVGEQGTLMLPALSYISVNKTQNLFDQKNTPSCVGIIPEIFRKEYPVYRSMHPTHSVSAMGKYAKEITMRHGEDRSPVGENSPFRRMLEYNAKILMLGCGLITMTYMHGVEEAVGTDYVMASDRWEFRMKEDGKEEWSGDYLHHDFAGYAQRYDRIENVMEKDIVCGKTLGGKSWLLSAAELERVARMTLDKDQHYFVDRV